MDIGIINCIEWMGVITLMCPVGLQLCFGLQIQTNTVVWTRVKNGPNSFILNKMISVAALLGVTVELNHPSIYEKEDLRSLTVTKLAQQFPPEDDYTMFWLSDF